MSAAAEFPSWVLLEPFVFRRDDDASFPNESKAPIRASGTTSWGADFRVAFSLAEPPRISRLYAQLPVSGFLDRREADPLAILATHRHLALLRVGTILPTMHQVQDFFIYSAQECSLKALPPCTEADFDYTSDGDDPAESDDGDDPAESNDDDPADAARLLVVESVGLRCGGGELVVAELTPFIPISRSKAFVDICLLRTSCEFPLDRSGATWKSMRVDIQCSNPDDIWLLCRWETDIVIPFHQWLCWMDYNRGILFCDMSKEPTPPFSFLRFPLREFPSTDNHSFYSTDSHTNRYSFLYRGVSVVDQALKFVNVTRYDGTAWGTLKPGTGFTITCHILELGCDGNMGWKEDYTVTSSELWDANLPDRLPRSILMFPRVDIDRPHVVHFLLSEFEYVNKKMWVVSIDMSTRTVESFSPYINGNDGLQTDDADLSKTSPWLPCPSSLASSPSSSIYQG